MMNIQPVDPREGVYFVIRLSGCTLPIAVIRGIIVNAVHSDCLSESGAGACDHSQLCSSDVSVQPRTDRHCRGSAPAAREAHHSERDACGHCCPRIWQHRSGDQPQCCQVITL